MVFVEDFFERIINVQWAHKKQFTIGAGGGNFGSDGTQRYWAQFARSRDGKTWSNVKSNADVGRQTWFEATISGSSSDIILAGGGKTLPIPGGGGATTNAAMTWISTDGGKSWSDAGFPFGGTGSFTSDYRWVGGFLKSGAMSLGYNPRSDTFYASVPYWSVDTNTDSISDWSLSMGKGSAAASAITNYFPGSGTVFGTNICSVTYSGATMNFTDSAGNPHVLGMGSDGFVTVDGSSVGPSGMGGVASAAAGPGGVIVAGGSGGDGLNMIMMSPDAGQSWKEILQELKQGNQGFTPGVTYS